MPKSSRLFDLVIFDCDGVLVDSEVIACHAVADTLSAFGYAIAADSIAERFTGMSDNDMYAILAKELGGPWPAGFDAAMQRRARERFERELRAVPGVEAAVTQLTLALCVASSSVPENLAYKLHRTGLFARFAPAIFSTAQVPRGKPAPDIFLYAAAEMGVAASRALVIEDSAPGVAAGKTAGMTVFGFTGGSHCGPGHAERLTAAGADLVFADMREVPRLIAQRNATLTTS